MRTLLPQTFCLMCGMQVLSLMGNQIGDTGVSALASACVGGALPQLKDLWVDGDAPALRAACEVRGITYR